MFFPVDSVLPQTLITHLGIGNFLAGANHDRIKTVKLRKEVSQGFVAPVQSILDYWNSVCPIPDTEEKDTKETLPNDLTQMLGVAKYEPPQMICKNANLVRLPSFVYMYDIEGCDNYPNIVEMLMDVPVMITEKLEGQNWGLSIDTENNIVVNQRRFAVMPKDGEDVPTIVSVAETEGWKSLIVDIKKKYSPNGCVTLRGELLGPNVQGNIYLFKAQTVRLFEIEIDGKPVSAKEFMSLVSEYNISNIVPVLSNGPTLREWLNGKTIQEASNGKSTLYGGLREGVVVKPLTESIIEGFGRLFIKQRSAEYLAKTDF